MNMLTRITTLLCAAWLGAAGALAQDRPAVVEIQTILGTIAVELDYASAPITSDNFVSYVNAGFYKDTLIHRVDKNVDFQVLQGGGIDRGTITLKPTNAPIVLESNNGLSNLTGTIAMARTSVPNSATSQFFINLVDNQLFDYVSSSRPGYAVFGHVVKGMSVVKSISALPTFSQLPLSGGASMVWIDAAYANAVWDKDVSVTRILLSGSGSVISEPGGLDCGETCTLALAAGTPLSIKAIPAKNFAFVGWRGDCQGPRRTLVIDTTRGNHNCTAVFLRQGAQKQ